MTWRPRADRDAALIAAWQGGRRAYELATEYGISKERVRQIMVRAGFAGSRQPQRPKIRVCGVCRSEYTGNYRIHARMQRHAITPSPHVGVTERTRAMADEYAAGGDARAIAARYDVTRRSVYRAALVVHGRLRYSRNETPHTPARALALQMLRAGEPSWFVAESTGVSVAELGYIRRRYLRAAS